MTLRSRPPAEIAIDASLVRALLEEQHPDLVHLPLVDSGEGWDNCLFRLGGDLCVRLPRRAASAGLIAHEQTCLPNLAARLPLPIPVPLRIGRPSGLFPWPWSVTPWFQGQTALLTPPQDPQATAVALGEFLRALHQPAPADAPQNPWRGVPLAARAATLEETLQQLDGLVDRGKALDVWQRALSAQPWHGPPVWIHGDLHPGNLLVIDGRLSAVIDFGDLAAGDPAVDLSIAWMLLPPSARPAFRAFVRDQGSPVNEDQWMRARGWALALGLAFLAHSGDDGGLRALARATIDAALNDSGP